MASKLFHLEIVTPKKILFSAEVESFAAPGIVGGFQVLVSHAPMMSSIGIGEVRVTTAQGTELKFATSGGFVEVKANNVILVAETAEASSEIDVQRAAASKERAKKRISEKGSGIDTGRAEVALLRAINRLKVAERT